MLPNATAPVEAGAGTTRAVMRKFLAVDRGDVRRITVEIGASDPELAAVRAIPR